MVDTSGQQNIRDLTIDRLVKGFSEQETDFKKFVTVSSTPSRRVDWVQKTAGFLSNVTTTGMTTNLGANMTQLAHPTTIRQSWTRNTSYVKAFMFDSPLISDQDIKDNIVDVFGVHVRDVTRKVVYDVNAHIWDIMSESRSVVNLLSVTTTAVGGDQWDAPTGLNPLKDIERAKRLIGEQNYKATHLFCNPKNYESLVVYLIGIGAQIPQVSSTLVGSGIVTNLLNLSVVVDNAVTADYAWVGDPARAVTVKEFTGLQSATIEEPMIGKKVRVKTELIGLLTDPKAGCLIIDTDT